MNTREQDSALLRAVREGDVVAFQQLYQRYAAGLLGFILHRVSNRSEAEELVQETFIRLLRDRNFEPDRAGLGTYLYIIARNLSYNHVRDNAAHRHSHLHGSDERMLRHRSSDEDGPDEKLERFEQVEALREVLHGLPDQQREAFILRHYHGRSYQEIAEITGIPVGTAKSRVHLALIALREALRPAIENVMPLFGARRTG